MCTFLCFCLKEEIGLSCFLKFGENRIIIMFSNLSLLLQIKINKLIFKI